MNPSVRQGPTVKPSEGRAPMSCPGLFGAIVFILCAAFAPPASAQVVEIRAEVLHDKIRGGLLGQLLGNLNGLPHEMKYIAEPGNVTEYVPALPGGAWTDDDTDIEWVHIVAMQRHGVTLLPPEDISALWKKHINDRIWCANLYTRQLMDIGMHPPLTGMVQFNPWSDFNISGQFAAEMFALIAPGMPRTASRIGLHYTRVTICGEPAQTTQLFNAMIATAFVTDDLQRILDAGVSALDPNSVIRSIVNDVRAWHKQHPDDWRATRRLVKEKYSFHDGAMRDRNGFELNTASAIAALLYGEGDYIKTSITAFNFGWDADNNAAIGTTIIGIIKGADWMMSQGWNIKDQYRNTTRAGMPMDETITSFGDRLIALAGQVIVEQGGKKTTRDGKTFYQINVEQTANVEPLSDGAADGARLRAAMQSEIEDGILRGTSDQQRARAAYQAICLDLAQSLREKHPKQWAEALDALNGYPKLGWTLFYVSDIPAGEELSERAIAAGMKRLRNPHKNKNLLQRLELWTPLPESQSGLTPAATVEESNTQPPNIVIIFADDLGYGDLGCYGHPSLRTPNLDRMAAEGMRFTDFYVAANVCTPSRAALLTGRLPIRSGMAGGLGAHVLLTRSTGGLPTNEITIAAALKTKDYATACIGKWHLGHLPQFMPTRHGFDYFFGVRWSNNMEPAPSVRRPRNAQGQLDPKSEWWRMALLRSDKIIEEDTDPHELTRRYTDEAIRFIKQNQRKPFFLYFAHTYPHVPLFASTRFHDQSLRGRYGDTVEEIDWSVGELLEVLRRENLATNTFVIFISDNGPSLTHGLAGGSAGVLRDGKGSTWEGGMRVPAIAWWPGKIKPGGVSRELACAMDLFNTSLALAGVPLPTDRILDGVDMTPMLLGEGPGRRETMFYYNTNQLYAVRKGPFKAHLITDSRLSADGPRKHDPPLLFHLGHDPAEKFNVASEHPDVIAAVFREIEKHRKEMVPGEPQY